MADPTLCSPACRATRTGSLLHNSRLVAFDGERVMFKWKDYRAKLDLKESLVAGNRDGEKCRSLATAPRMGCASSGGGGCRLVLRVSQLPQSPPAIRHP